MREEKQKIIEIRGAKQHNLKNINLNIPREKLIVITGLSGSGKSTLAFDTLYAEGQRRYVESLSAYVRQFLGQMEKPDVESIKGLPPAISIDQKTTSHNPRSTVATVTEIADYMRLLYARIGDKYCHQCGHKLTSFTVDQIIEAIYKYPPECRLYIFAPLVKEKKGTFVKEFTELQNKGFSKIRVNGEIFSLENPPLLTKTKKHNLELLVDRIILKPEIRSRLADSIEQAITISKGQVLIKVETKNENGSISLLEEQLFSTKNSCPTCEISIGEITPRHFSFNNPLGACPACNGLGYNFSFKEENLIEDENKSLSQGAIQLPGFNISEENSWIRAFIDALAKEYNFSVDTPLKDLPRNILNIIFYGNNKEKIKVDTSKTKYTKGDNYYSSFQGIIPILEKRYRETSSEEMKKNYENFMSIKLCDSCKGARLRKESLAVKIMDKNIYDWTLLSIKDAKVFLEDLIKNLEGEKLAIATKILKELQSKMQFLIDVGLSYISLARSSVTLSGGEAQRIRLASQIGSGLTGVLYILDEPSIGLHQRDNDRLIATLKKLRDLGNTVIVVEHDADTMAAADWIIDIGPLAGEHGGEVVAACTYKELLNHPTSLTGAYLSGRKKIELPASRREGNGENIEIYGASLNNLKNIDVKIPLACLVCVTGVSGSGKSSLVNGILLPYLQKKLSKDHKVTQGKYQKIVVPDSIDKVISIDQSPIGKTPRSNPATYTGVFDLIRQLYSQTKESLRKGYKAGRFSFNVKGGRCEACQGDGQKKIEMHFLPDIYIPCDICQGKRYNYETLEIKYKDKNISEVLDLTVEQAFEFFQDIPSISRKIETLKEVGLGYIKLGQSSTTLSGGEAQRVKLAYELSKRNTGKTFYILDEPTTGLHIADTHQLIKILQNLVNAGNSVLIIEHNLDIIKMADWIIDMGYEGGELGGQCIAEGTCEQVASNSHSHTGRFLKPYLIDKKSNDINVNDDNNAEN